MAFVYEILTNICNATFSHLGLRAKHTYRPCKITNDEQYCLSLGKSLPAVFRLQWIFSILRKPNSL